MKTFRSRNPLTIGVTGIVVIVLILLAAVYSDDLPIVGGGTTYQAEFSEAAGITTNDEVRVAGVKVGKITDVDLAGDHVLISFKVQDTWVGDRSRAAIKIKTLLGQKFLALEPDGSEVLDPGTPIPRDRTAAPYDVLEAFRGLAETVDQIDTVQLAQSFGVLSQTFSDTPEDVRSALSGLSALSKTVSSRDDQLARLLDNAKQISRTLADRDAEVVELLQDGNVLLSEIRERKEAISALLTGTKQLGAELKGLVDDNNQQLGPVLAQLDTFTSMLQRNEDALGKGIEALAPFVRQFGNTIGNGRWIDAYICGFLPPSIGPINEEGCLL